MALLRAIACLFVLGAASARDQRKFPSREDQPNIEEVGIKGVIDWTKERLVTADAAFKSGGFRRQPSPESWDNEAVYYVMVDRFANGDLKNDLINVPELQVDQLASGEPYDLGQWRHGGDLEGLRQRLGYLQDLGISVIWLSPILLQAGGQPEGYFQTDPSMIDPGFGSKDLFRQLVHEAHERGLYVVLDVLTNQASSPDFKYQDAPTIDEVTACVNSAERAYWNTSVNLSIPGGAPIVDQGELQWGTEVPFYFRNETLFQRCGSSDQFRPDGQRFQDMPHVYNSAKATFYEAGLLWAESFHSPADEPDFATMNPNFQEMYTNLLNYWIAYADIDGYRFDAAKYISADYAAYLATHTRSFAASLGKKDFFVTGEMLEPGGIPFLYSYVGAGPQQEDHSPACLAHSGCSGLGLMGDCCPSPGGFLSCCFLDYKTAKPMPERVTDMHKALKPITGTLMSPGPGLPTIYPTDDSAFVRDILMNTSNGTAFWESDDATVSIAKTKTLLEEQGLAEWSWMLFESQDIPRLLQDPKIGLDLWRLQAGLVWSFTWWGIPTLYYGVEQGFNGLCNMYDPWAKNLSKEMAISKHVGKDAYNSLLQICEEREKDSLKRQDMFTGAPWLLGSAILSVQQFANIEGRQTPALPPYWCEEPLLDRSNEAFVLVRALTRIRKSCPVLSSLNNTRATTSNPMQFAYWKVAKNPSSAPAMLVVLDLDKEPSTDSWSFGLPADDAQQEAVLKTTSWVDLLNPKRTAVLMQRAGGGPASLVIDNSDTPAHHAVFVSADEVQDDQAGATWKVCKAKAATLPPLPMVDAECQSSFLWLTALLMVLFVGVLVLVLLRGRRKNGVFLCIVKEPSPVEVLEYPDPDAHVEEPKHVFVAAVEHTIPERKVKVSAGGLGKVLDQMLREHPPGRLSLVHPKFSGVDYGPMELFTTIEVTVDMHIQMIQVYTLESTEGEIHRVWYLLQHEWFETLISKDAPYPYPQTKLSVLRFFSLWNQAAAQLMVMLKPDIYHCMDYHAAMVPLYVAPADQIPMIIVLHNADYDGAIETEFISDVFWKSVPALRRLSLIFNLEMTAIHDYVTFEGRFNMLWGGIACIEENQKGHGICTVSGKYAAELKRERTMFKGLPAVLPLDNAIDSAADEMPKSVSDLKKMRDASKQALQQFCELNVDPEAKILIFVGRWVKQKGVDHIALLASRILDSHPEVQFVLAGPPGDPYGSYAQELLRPLADQYHGRLFVVTRFFMIPKEARAGAHLCLMPSCSEPFGYVDVEFGLLGVPSLGCAIGGLGKMPGVYFRQQNSDSQTMLLAGFSAAVQYALKMDEQEYWEMALACIPAEFPFSTWRANLRAIYRHAQLNFCWDVTARRKESLSLDKGYSVLIEDRAAGYRRLGLGNITRGDSAKNARKHKQEGDKVQHHLQRMQVDEASEFLLQPVSETRVKELMSYWMASESQETDAETLQKHISLGDQRMNERNFATRGLMHSSSFQCMFGGDSCLRIHAIIAMGYIISPVMDARLGYLSGNAKSFAGKYPFEILSYSATNIGCVLGCFLWLWLSRSVPANLLMACSLFLNQLFFNLVNVFLALSSPWIVIVFDLICGVLTTSRWLFLIWNFNEDFHGGFQVGTRRVALIEALRSAVAEATKIQIEGLPTGIIQTLFSAVVLLLIMLIMLAPQCYCTYVLPNTNFWKELRDHKVYVLLILSMAVNGMGAFVWQQEGSWLSMNGFTNSEVSVIKFCQSIALIVVLAGTFLQLHKMSIWGPWVMRDFTCFLPPGSLLFALAFWNLGYLHYRSYVFVTALTVGSIIDVMRFAAFWTAILTTLANKWYALIGAFAGFGLIKACEAASPIVAHIVAMPWGCSPIFSRLVFAHPETNLLTLQKATLLSVWPISILAYVVQILAWKSFVPEVLTYKGHGNLMPDGSQGWEESESVFMKASEIKSKRSRGSDSETDHADEFTESSEDSESSEEL